MQCKMTNRLTERLAAKRVKKSQLAFWLKMSRAHVTRLERGEVRPSLETALRIARYFGKPVEEIFQLADEELKTISRPVSVTSGAQTKNNAEIGRAHV